MLILQLAPYSKIIKDKSISKKSFNNHLLDDIFEYSDSKTSKISKELNNEINNITFPIITEDL